MRKWDESLDDAALLSQEGQEVWTPVEAAPSRYLVSNLGRVYSKVAPGGAQVMKNTVMPSGYEAVGIYASKGAKATTRTVHRLVATAFFGEPPTPEHVDVRHLDGDCGNNKLDNLAWGTRSENMRDLWTHRKKRVKRKAQESPTPNPTYSMPEDSVQRGIKLFEKGNVSLDDLSVLWDVSRDVARRALVGETWPDLQRDLATIESRLGRAGSKSHLSKLTEESVAEAFQLYTEHHWSGVKFSAHLGIKQVTGHQILSGKTWKHVLRPEGFSYPWPDARTMNAQGGSGHHATKLTEAQVVKALAGVVSGRLSCMEDAKEELGLSKSAVSAIMRGKTWVRVSRPEGLEEAWEKVRRNSRGKKATKGSA
jgi:hypothetical protein